MKTLKAILISSALVVSALSSPLHAQDKGNAASMQDLLKQLENQHRVCLLKLDYKTPYINPTQTNTILTCFLFIIGFP